ncbi:hypothetical protein O9929_17060 [Vibrio lentus]|nr:hypothetical protein [Vibrio lentus]
MYSGITIKDHTLLQAICRTNRLYPNKTFGCIVDYFGVFDDAAKALEFGMKKAYNKLSLTYEPQVLSYPKRCKMPRLM